MYTEADIRKLIARYKGTIWFPKMRQVRPGLMANQIVAVQPMTLPSGLLYWLDYKFGSSGSSDVSGSNE